MNLKELYGVYLTFKLARSAGDRRTEAQILKRNIQLIQRLLRERGRVKEAEEWESKLGLVDSLVGRIEKLKERALREWAAGGIRPETRREYSEAVSEFARLTAESVQVLSDLIGPFTIEDALASVRRYKALLGLG